MAIINGMEDKAVLLHLANLSRGQTARAKTSFARDLSLKEAEKWESLANKPTAPLSYAEWKAQQDKRFGMY